MNPVVLYNHLNQILSKVHHFLSDIETKERELSQAATTLKCQRHIITSEQIHQLRAEHLEAFNYLTGNDVLAIDPVAHATLAKSHEVVITLRAYKKAEE